MTPEELVTVLSGYARGDTESKKKFGSELGFRDLSERATRDIFSDYYGDDFEFDTSRGEVYYIPVSMEVEVFSDGSADVEVTGSAHVYYYSFEPDEYKPEVDRIECMKVESLDKKPRVVCDIVGRPPENKDPQKICDYFLTEAKYYDYSASCDVEEDRIKFHFVLEDADVEDAEGYVRDSFNFIFADIQKTDKKIEDEVEKQLKEDVKPIKDADVTFILETYDLDVEGEPDRLIVESHGTGWISVEGKDVPSALNAVYRIFKGNA